uniref:Keratinocyte differentiation associated protein n=1 Tax=Nannospalax galili TaxID=1026970 RepID=A0A8C6RPL1_NANGA
MKISILPVVALLSLLALHTAQGAALGVANYDAESKVNTIPHTLLQAFKSDDFLNWHVLSDLVRKAFPFINWEYFPKVKGLRSAAPDSQ